MVGRGVLRWPMAFDWLVFSDRFIRAAFRPNPTFEEVQTRSLRADMRLRLGLAMGSLLSRYLYDLVGLWTLRGYRFKQFTGDRMMLFNVYYWLTPMHTGTAGQC